MDLASIRRLLISDDVLFDKLVLKGGNAFFYGLVIFSGFIN